MLKLQHNILRFSKVFAKRGIFYNNVEYYLSYKENSPYYKEKQHGKAIGWKDGI